jgi:hypothetical protein
MTRTQEAPIAVWLVSLAAATAGAHAEWTKNIVITGYWPPTNEMIRPFSTDPVLNPRGWIGANWENRGYDIYAYFPTFADPDCTNCGAGMGDLTVDYQDTSADFWPIVDAHDPVAIITFSRTNANFSWECENNGYNYTSWTNDYAAPLQPTPNPPDGSVPGGFLRTSSLPQQAIVDAVNSSGLGLNSFICFAQSSGSFLSGFMAYHGMWYQGLHSAENDPARCVAAGHIHVGDTIAWDTGHEATKVTLRVLLDHVDALLGGPGDVNVDGQVDIDDLLAVINAWGPCPVPPDACPADLNDDGAVDVDDLLAVISNWG